MAIQIDTHHSHSKADIKNSQGSSRHSIQEEACRFTHYYNLIFELYDRKKRKDILIGRSHSIMTPVALEPMTSATSSSGAPGTKQTPSCRNLYSPCPHSSAHCAQSHRKECRHLDGPPCGLRGNITCILWGR